MFSGVKCEKLCLKCCTKMLILAAPVLNTAAFFVSFMAVKSANENCAV
jgi:hypothetical protein